MIKEEKYKSLFINENSQNDNTFAYGFYSPSNNFSKLPIGVIFNTSKNYSNKIDLENEILNIYSQFIEFKKFFLEQDIYINNEEELLKFFIYNKDNLNIQVLNIFLQKIREEFTGNREIIFSYDEGFKYSLCFCIRQKHNDEANLNELISKVEDKIIDMLEDDYPSFGFNISFYMDYKEPEFLNVRKVSSGV